MRRIDGIPLAIELAASRVKLLQPAEIASRLDECFRLLRGGSVDALPHHQTLERAIDWSYDMLSADQQLLFCQLSVFRGGFTFPACTAVSGVEDEFEVLETLGQLVDKSLVQAESGGEETRYHLLEPLRQYGASRITGEDAAEAGDRHAEYFLDLAEQAGPELRGPRQLEWLDRLETEHDNIRVALVWSLDSGKVDVARRTASALTWFWLIRRNVLEANGWFERALAVDGGSPQVHATALVLGSFIRSNVHPDDLEACLERVREGLSTFVELGDQQGIGTALTYEALLMWYMRDLEASSLKFAEIQPAMQAAGFEWGDAFCDWFLGSAAWLVGDLTPAREHFTRGLEKFRNIEDLMLIAWSLLPLANISLGLDELDQATDLYNQSLPMMDELGDRLGVGTVLVGLGTVAQFRGETDEAGRLIAEAQVHLREGTGGQGLSWTTSNAPVDTSTHDLLLEATSRYQAGINLPTDEWTRMVLADAEAWRERHGRGGQVGRDAGGPTHPFRRTGLRPVPTHGGEGTRLDAPAGRLCVGYARWDRLSERSPACATRRYAMVWSERIREFACSPS